MTTVIFATHNGEVTLGRMLSKFTELLPIVGGVEILAVDNASSDRTAEIIRQFESRLPIRYFRCDRRGKNIALNHAVEFARGSLVVFTDDDVLPAPDWLQQFHRLAEAHPEIGLFGGRIVPEWPTAEVPRIIRYVNSQAAFGIHPPGVIEGTQDPGMIWGANMMARITIFQKGFRFNEMVGPSVGQYVMGSEVEFNRRVSATEGCFYSNLPVVRHMIRPQQLQRQWLLSRAERFGKYQCISTLSAERQSEAQHWGIPRWRIRTLVTAYIKAIATGSFANTTASIKHAWQVHEQLGFISQMRAVDAGNDTSRA